MVDDRRSPLVGQNRILNNVYDEDNNVLRTSANVEIDASQVNIGDVGKRDSDENPITEQNPEREDDGSIYVKDLTPTGNDIGTFTGTNEDINKLFNNLDDSIVDNTSTNPKYFEFKLNRPQTIGNVGIVAHTGNYSNVKVIFKDRQDNIIQTRDDTSNNTKYTARNYSILAKNTCCIRVEFHTTDTVNVSFLRIPKDKSVSARIKGINDKGQDQEASFTNQGNMKMAVYEYGDTPSIDPFDRLRVSTPFTLFDSKQLYDKNPLFWDEAIGGSATSVHSTTNARTRMSVTASSSDYVIRQTKQRFNYQPGKGQLILMTFFNEQVAGLTKRVGAFDGTGTNNLTPNNGIFFETDGGISWNIAKNGTITETVTQANWNADTLDGSGDANNLSGLTLNDDATQIAIIDFEWLGVGRVRVGFVIDGIIRYVHYFNHANDSSFDSVYMSTPNLPLRYDIQSDGTNGGYLDHICSTVMAEGGYDANGVLRSINRGSNKIDANTVGNTYSLIAIRLKSTHLDTSIIPINVTTLAATSDAYLWKLLGNPTISGTLTWNDLDDSAIQYAIPGDSNVITDEGVVTASGYTSDDIKSDTSDIKTSIKLGSQIDGTRDILVLAITPIGSFLDCYGSITWRELQ